MTSDERIRVMVVDDHSILRVGLKHVLEESGEFEVVGQAADGEEAVRVAAEVSPDVVVMDVMMPRKDGVEACREIMEAAPEDPCSHVDGRERGKRPCWRRWPLAPPGIFRRKPTGSGSCQRCEACSGESFACPLRLCGGVVAAIRSAAEVRDAADDAGLTAREREILVSFAGGMSYARIAEQRGIKPVYPFGTPSTASRRSWGLRRCRAWCSGQRGTGCWMTFDPES